MRKFLFILLALFGVAQFIRPDLDAPASDPAQDLIVITRPSDEVASLLRTACYDCHSNETRYPWYDRITPVNWWVQHHVNEGREEANFSRWGELSEKKRKHFAEEAIEMITEAEMPLPSYTWMHGDAKLSEEQKLVLSEFFVGLR